MNDRTSFDTFVEFRTPSNESGFLGIEVKYTEHEYKLKQGSKEDDDICNTDSAYNRISNKHKLFIDDAFHQLKSDRLRQIWRKHLLGESMLIHPALNFKQFVSVILYPSGNIHFKEVIPEYQSLLLPEQQSKPKGITFESYFDTLVQHNTSPAFAAWIEYLKSRYIL